MKKNNANEPYYIQVYNLLKQQIDSNKIQKNSYLPSERELGLKFDVDRLTIRKALAMLVDDGLVEKRAGIGTYVKELPLFNIAKQGSADVKNILIVFPSFDKPNSSVDYTFRANVLFSVQKECRKHGYNSICVQDMPDSNLSALINGSSFEGIIFVSSVSENVLEESIALKIPSVIIDKAFDGMTSIVSDNEDGIRQAIRNLTENSHKNIAVITGLAGDYNAEERLKAVKKIAAELNLRLPETHIAEGNWTYQGGYQAMKKLLDLADAPTAVLAANDATAFGAICAVHEAGIKVPEDISIIGFDNIDKSAYTMPKLSTVSVNVEHNVRIACMHLFYHIETGAEESCRIIVPVRLIERSSVTVRKK